MAYEETSVFDAPPAPAAAPVAAVEAAPLEAPAPPEAPEAPAPAEAPAEVPAAPAPAPAYAPLETPAPAAPADAPAAFDEKAYLRQHLGEQAPESAAALKTRFDELAANQLTDAQRGQLAVLADPAQLEAYAKIAGRDYDQPSAAEVMREKFALDHPEMSPAMAARRFAQQFTQTYPTLAAALDHPDEVDVDDPALLAEKEDADYDALAARTALKTNQQTVKESLFAAARAAQAPTAPQYSPAQIADAQAVVQWSDETFRAGATLPIDVGNGQVVQVPIGDPAAFKAAFLDTDKTYRAQVFTPEGTINRQAQAKIALFLQNPQAYDAAIANAVKSAQPPGITLDELTNSAPQAPAKPAAAPAAARQPAPTADWQNYKI